MKAKQERLFLALLLLKGKLNVLYFPSLLLDYFSIQNKTSVWFGSVLRPVYKKEPVGLLVALDEIAQWNFH
jgi:hypothetical protein